MFNGIVSFVLMGLYLSEFIGFLLERACYLEDGGFGDIILVDNDRYWFLHELQVFLNKVYLTAIIIPLLNKTISYSFFIILFESTPPIFQLLTHLQCVLHIIRNILGSLIHLSFEFLTHIAITIILILPEPFKLFFCSPSLLLFVFSPHLSLLSF